MPRLKPRSSRRVASLQDKDYDHEISLVDNAPEPELDGDGEGSGDAVDGPAKPTFAVAVTPSTDGAGDAAADNDNDAPTRRPSHLEVSGLPSRSASVSLSVAASTTPLLGGGMSSINHPTTAAAGPSRSRSSSQASARGRQPQQYGSIADAVSAPLDMAPSVQIDSATPDEELGQAAGAGSSTQGKQPEQATQPAISQQPTRQSMLSVVRQEPEVAIDVLYENERGLFLCGIPLFSRQALGNLDPSPWTNAAGRTSPTDIYTAQVPDPTWEWAWPEWRINHDADAGTDDDGWQYSFMFARAFSWHGPSWYRSFVRRRVWIRKRVRRTTSASVSAAASALGLGTIDSTKDPNLLNPDYFTVVSAASMRRSSSRASSRCRRGSRLSVAAPSVGGQSSAASAPCIYSGGPETETVTAAANEDKEDRTDDADADADAAEMPSTITDIDVLMKYLRAARIDREKIEAVGNYIANAGDDLVRLQDYMHEIMALFVFQASRRALLTQLIAAHDAAVRAQQDDDGTAPATPATPATSEPQALDRCTTYLTAAVKHADEEVRRLEYWSDIKAMAQQGSATGAVDKTDDGWDADAWQGVDQSGPAPPPTKADE